MKFIIIHNRYSHTGGEENVVLLQRHLLEQNGHSVVLYQRDYNEIRGWIGGRVAGSLSALYNGRAVRELRGLVRRERPDVAIVHNLFPVISGAVLPMLKAEGVALMMTLHNYRLVCPNGLFFTHSQICERCGSSPLGKWNCLFRGCMGSLGGSAAFALRGWFSTELMRYFDNVDLFLALSDFQVRKLGGYGFSGRRFRVIPNAIDPGMMPASDLQQEDYVGFVGRLSAEKGVDLLLDTARRMPHLRFKVAGQKALEMSDLPPNLELVGFLDRQQLADFYAGARVVILTSRCYDNFPLSVIEAMYYRRAVVVPKLASMSEIVDNQRCGLLFTTPEELVEKIQLLFDDPNLRQELASNGHQRVMEVYNVKNYYNNIMQAAQSLLAPGADGSWAPSDSTSDSTPGR